MTLLSILLYLFTFTSVTLFIYASIRVLKDFSQVPLMDDDMMGTASIRRNPFYKVLMFFTRLLARVNLNLNLGGYEALLKKNLDAAGRPWDLKPTEYLALKQLSAFLVFGLGILLHLGFAGYRFPLFNAFILVIFGYFVPNIFVNRITKQRHMSILQDLPFCCDLLTLAVEAGLDFGTALEKVVINGPPGPLRDELYMVLQQSKIGKTRREALSDFAARIQLQEVTSFSGAIIQADRMGTGFAHVLRIQSTQVRASRFERAEKAATKLPVKILFPIIIVNLLSIGIILIIPLLSTISTFIQ